MNGFWNAWQHLPERMDPVIFQIGWFKLQYYGLMYIVAFATVYGLVRLRVKHERRFDVTPSQIGDFSVNLILGIIIGARLGICGFLQPGLLPHPSAGDRPALFVCRRVRLYRHFGHVLPWGADRAPAGRLAHGTPRRSGLPADGPICMHRPCPWGTPSGGSATSSTASYTAGSPPRPSAWCSPRPRAPGRRHPSQLYEAFFEGIFLFAVLWLLRKRKLPAGAMLAFYLIGYGTVPFFHRVFPPARRAPGVRVAHFFHGAGALCRHDRRRGAAVPDFTEDVGYVCLKKVNYGCFHPRIVSRH